MKASVSSTSGGQLPEGGLSVERELDSNIEGKDLPLKL